MLTLTLKFFSSFRDSTYTDADLPEGDADANGIDLILEGI